MLAVPFCTFLISRLRCFEIANVYDDDWPLKYQGVIKQL